MKKNKLNLHIYGMHLLNPYKTVVNLNLFPQWTSTCIYASGILENRVVHEMANSPTQNMKVHVKMKKIVEVIGKKPRDGDRQSS